MRNGFEGERWIDYYRLLGVNPDARLDEIKRNYRDRCRECHPDLNPENDEAHLQMQLLNEAYQVLSNNELRDEYDLVYYSRVPQKSNEAVEDFDPANTEAPQDGKSQEISHLWGIFFATTLSFLGIVGLLYALAFGFELSIRYATGATITPNDLGRNTFILLMSLAFLAYGGKTFLFYWEQDLLLHGALIYIILGLTSLVGILYNKADWLLSSSMMVSGSLYLLSSCYFLKSAKRESWLNLFNGKFFNFADMSLIYMWTCMCVGVSLLLIGYMT